MQTLLEALREVIGSADFYIENGNYSGTWNYGSMIEYLLAGLILLVVVSSVFKFILNVVKG